MALVNQTIPGLFGGVSQQAPELRHDTQVTEMVNCMPTVVGGVQKRRPSELVYTDSEIPTDCFVYTYDRGAGNETYTIFIRDDGNFRIFDLIDKVWVNDWTFYEYFVIPVGMLAIDCFSLTTVGDTTFIVNKTKTTSMADLGDTEDPFYYYKLTDAHLLNPIADTAYYDPYSEWDSSYTVYNINSTVRVSISYTVNGLTRGASRTKTYNNSSTSFFTLPLKEQVLETLYATNFRDDNDLTSEVFVTGDKIKTLVPIQDFTITFTITVGNNTVTGNHLLQEYTEDTTWDKTFFYWVSRTAGDDGDNSSLRYTYYIKSDDPAYTGNPTTTTTNGTMTDSTKTFPPGLVGLTLYNVTSGESATITAVSGSTLSTSDSTLKFYTTDKYELGIQAISHDSTEVVKSLATQINGVGDPNYEADFIGSVLRVRLNNGYRLYGSDSWGNQATTSWQGRVSKLQDLPQDLNYEGTVIEITGDDKVTFDSFFVEYKDGVYVETVKPGLNNVINASSMPHKLELRRQGDALYTCNIVPAIWSERGAGDEFTASEPSFIGNTINDVFFYRNRLGFMSNDNVILSETGEYFNFFPTTITATIDSDPIDVAVDSNKAVTLQYALPFNKELLIFGDKTQFVLSSNDTLTPNNVSVQQSTAFDTTKVKPVALGPNVYFVVEKNNYSNVLEYYNQPDASSNDASNTTAHCPNYLPVNIKKLVGSSANDMLFALSTEENNTLYVYNFYWNGEEKAQSAWHKWTVDGVINNIEVINNELVLFITRNGNENIESIKLDTITDFDSLEYVDVDDTKYTSLITLTEIGFPSGKLQVDDKRNKLMLKNMQVNADYGSLYKVKVDKYNKPKKFMYNPGMLNVRPTLADVPIQTRNYDYVTALGFFPNQYLTPGSDIFPGTLSYTMKSDNRYVITGDVKNLEISIYNDIEGGFKINSIDFLGSYVNKSRSV